MSRPKTVDFSEARQNLSAIVDGVERTGKPVTILRRGNPAAVVVSAADFDQRYGRQAEWKLAGSLKSARGVNIEKAIREVRTRAGSAQAKKIARLKRELAED